MNDSIALVRDLYDAFAAGDVPTVLAAFAPDIQWNEAEGNNLAEGNPYVGGEAVLNGVFGPVLQEWEGFRVEVGEIVGGPGVVTMFGRYHGVHTASGKTLSVQCAHTWWIADGKITRFQQMLDTLNYARAQE